MKSNHAFNGNFRKPPLEFARKAISFPSHRFTTKNHFENEPSRTAISNRIVLNFRHPLGPMHRRNLVSGII
jgi:hypothetical protein